LETHHRHHHQSYVDRRILGAILKVSIHTQH
jgi:hypothetical protein